MAYSIVSTAQNVNLAAGTSLATSTSITVQAGDIIAVIASCASTTATCTISFGGLTFTQPTGSPETGLGTAQQRWFYATATGSTTSTVTATWNSSVSIRGIVAVVIRGCNAFLTSESNYQASPGTGSNAVTSGLLGTLASQPAALIGFSFDAAGTSAPNAGTGFTSAMTGWDVGAGAIMRIEHRRLTATASVAATFTATSGTSPHVTIGIAFAETPETPDPPTGVSATGTSSSEVTVDWDTEVGDTRYDVRIRSTGTPPSATTQSSAPWHLRRIWQTSTIHATQYQYRYTGDGVRIYVMDTGVRHSHNEFDGRASLGYDAAGGSGADAFDHGTGVASAAAGETYGSAKGATIINVRVGDTSFLDEEYIESMDYANDYLGGIDWILNSHPAGTPGVVVHSLMPPGDVDGAGTLVEEDVEEGFEALIAAGIVPVLAAGNANQQVPSVAPYTVEGVITCGGCADDDSYYVGSHGPLVDIVAPAASVPHASAASDSATATSSGTSFSAPTVAGICAMLLEESPHATPARIKQTLLSQATSGDLTGVPSSTVNLLAYSMATATDWVQYTDVGSPTFTIDGLEPGHEYEVAVRRVNGGQTSAWSTEVTARTQVDADYSAAVSAAASFVAALSFARSIVAGMTASDSQAATADATASVSASASASDAVTSTADAAASITAGAQAGHILSAQAAALAAITEAIEAGDTDAAAEAAARALSAAVAAADETMTAVAAALAAISAGIEAGESWAVSAQAAASLAAGGEFGATFDSAVDATATGSVTSATDVAATFVSAAAAIASLTGAVSLTEAIDAIAAASAAFTNGAVFGSNFIGSTAGDVFPTQRTRQIVVRKIQRYAFPARRRVIH